MLEFIFYNLLVFFVGNILLLFEVSTVRHVRFICCRVSSVGRLAKPFCWKISHAPLLENLYSEHYDGISEEFSCRHAYSSDRNVGPHESESHGYGAADNRYEVEE